MTRTEQERLVERYLSGDMSSADEQEFFIQVAVDNNLRQTLKAYRIVESAIRKHRDALPSRHAELRSKVVDMMKAIPVVDSEPATAVAAPSAVPAPPQGGITRMGPAMFRWIIAMVAAVGFTVAGFIVASFVGKTPEEITPSSDVRERMDTEAGAVKAPASEAPPRSAQAPASQEAGVTVSPAKSEQSGTVVSAGTPQIRPARSQERSGRASTATASSAAAQKPSQDQPGSSEPAVEDPSAISSVVQDGSDTQEPALKRRSEDTVPFRMQFKPPSNNRR